MDNTTKAALDRILLDKAIPGRDDARLHNNLTRLVTVLEHARTQTPQHQEEICAHTAFYLEQTLDRTTRFLLSPKLTNQAARQGLLTLQNHIFAIKEEYLTLRNERILIHHDEHLPHSLATDLNATPFKHIPYSIIDVPTDARKTVFSTLSAQRTAQREKTYFVHPTRTPQQEAWNLELICAPKCWEHSNGMDVKVGVIDTGIDYTHNLLKDRFERVKGYNFVSNTEDPQDDHGHGTHVAGTVAADTLGVAPGCTLYGLKFLDENGMGVEGNFLRAAEWAIDYNLHILNGSFGSTRQSDAERAMTQALSDHNILFIAAAGNNGTTEYSYPASYETVVSVAAVDRNKAHAYFSQRNDQVALCAPGVNVKSTIPGGFASYNGTSMAAPHVTGAAALVWGAIEEQDYVRELLRTSAEGLGDSQRYGAGLVRPDKALDIDALRRKWSA